MPRKQRDFRLPTDSVVQSKTLKPKEKTYTVTDDRGLYVEVSPTGGVVCVLSRRTYHVEILSMNDKKLIRNSTAEFLIFTGQASEQSIEARYEDETRSEEHTSALQSLMRISYAVFCLKKKIPLLKPSRSILTTLSPQHY